MFKKIFFRCHSYFPKKEETIEKFEYCQCELLSEEIKQHYVIRQIRLTFIEPKKKNNITDEKTNLANDIDEPLNAVNNKPNSRIIHHFQYMTWPDFGVPENTEHFLEFLFNVRNINNTIATDGEISNEGSKESVQKRSPIVCHCSAGIGRTGFLFFYL